MKVLCGLREDEKYSNKVEADGFWIYNDLPMVHASTKKLASGCSSCFVPFRYRESYSVATDIRVSC